MLIADRYECCSLPLYGGMGAVFPCTDKILERDVAIKMMPSGADERRIKDELKALFKMRSKHVVQVYDVIKHEGNLGVVLEYVDGVDLFDPSVFPESGEDYLKLIWQIASGIADIHELGIIHRDIKPNNMKIDSEGVVKIFDFGLARDNDEAMTYGFVGTPGFAAPELYENREVEFDKSIDIYAFGATALYLLMQGLPDSLKKQPPELSDINFYIAPKFHLSNEITELLDKCIAHDPSARPEISNIRAVLGKFLLKDQHKALVVFNETTQYLHSESRSVRLNLPNMGLICIGYDGLTFNVTEVSGDVYINNIRAKKGGQLPGACVVALGAPDQKSKRRYVTFDLSHPEIVL